jgi:flagellar motor switch protein FliM
MSAERTSNSNVLSADEIDSLLKAIRGGDEDEKLHASIERNKTNVQYIDFIDFNPFTKRGLRELRSVLEHLAKYLTTFFSARSKRLVHVWLKEMNPETFEQYRRSLCIPGLMWTIKSRGMIRPIAFQMEPSLFKPVFNVSRSSDEYKLSDLTDSDMKKIMPYLKSVTHLFNYVWNSTFHKKNMNLMRHCIEFNPFFFEAALPDEMGLVVTYEISVMENDEKTEGSFTLFIPAAAYGTNGEFPQMVDHLNIAANTVNTILYRKNIDSKTNKVKVKVTAVLGEADITIGELKKIKPSSIIILNNNSDSPLNVYSGNTLFAQGNGVTSDDNYAVKIQKIL